MEWQHALPWKLLAVAVLMTTVITTTRSQWTTTSPHPMLTPIDTSPISSPAPPIAYRTQARLMDGTQTDKYLTGRLELSFSGNDWKGLCNYRIDNYVPSVVCKSLGYLSGLAVSYAAYGNGTGIHPISFRCRSSRSSLDGCSTRSYDTSFYCDPASLVCYNNTKDVLTLRLADGTSTKAMASGRLEVGLADLGWGAVCSRGNSYMFSLACEYMGYKHGKSSRAQAPENGTLDFTVYGSRCQYGTTDIMTGCNFQLINSVYYCSYFLALSCVNASVRLQTKQDDVLNAGTVEMMTSSRTWGEVCDSDWDDRDAYVVCRELGFADGRALCCNQLGATTYGSMSVSSAHTNVSCSGNEPSLVNCSMSTIGARHSCPFVNGKSTLASVICYEKPKDQIDMSFKTKLNHEGVDNSAEGWGRVLVRRYGFWGEVCPDDFTDVEASVACRSLSQGYVGGKAFGGYATKRGYHIVDGMWQKTNFVEPNNPVWISNVTCAGNETSLDQCEVGAWGVPKTKCSASSGVICYRKDLELRLVKEGSKNFGRLEIVHDGLRGSVCADGFDDKDADIACRQLNFTKGYLVTGDGIPNGAGTVFMSHVRCDSDDMDLFSCYSWWKNATDECKTHSNDAKVSCFNDIGLKDGTHRTGILVVYDQSGNPKKLCDNGYFDDKAALVACRALGFTKGLALPPYVYGRSSLRVNRTLVGLQCAGTELSLTECPRNTSASCTDYSVAADYASVSCYDKETTEDKYTLDMAPEEGPQLAGRVRVFSKQTFGYVCQHHWSDDVWNDAAASVVCRQQGRMGGVVLNVRGYVQGPFFITNATNCSAADNSLDTCTTSEPTTYCSSARTAGVLCYNSDAPNVTLVPEGSNPHIGRLSISIDKEEGRVCGLGWTTTSGRMACRMLGYNDGMALRFPKSDKPVFMAGVRCYQFPKSLFYCDNSGWRRGIESNCTSDDSTEAGLFCFMNAKINSYRPQITNNITGLVQLKLSSTVWRYACSNLGSANAIVICREMGFNRALEQNRGSYSYYSSRIVLRCNGSETRVDQCSFTTQRRCYSARLFCYNANANEEWTWKIEKGYHGRVEVTHQGMRGYICASGWDDKAADALCRQNKYKGGIVLGASASLRYRAVVWFSNVTCPEGATDMKQCEVNTTVDTTCRSYSAYPASVLCYNDAPPTVRIVDGLTNAEGRVEIEFNGVKGSVCRKSWSRYDARVLCKQLDFRDGQTMRAPRGANHSGPVYMSGVKCRLHHKTLFSCPSYGWKANQHDTSCQRGSYDAWISCYRKVRILGDRRTIGPVSYYNGYLYQLVCSEGFDDTGAKLVCQEMGLLTGVALYPRAFGYQSGSMGQVVDCSGDTVQSFADCLNRTDVSCRNSRNYASVACSNQADTTAYKVSMQWTDHGIVDVDYFNQTGNICYDDFDDNDAVVVCREKFYLTGVAYSSLPSLYSRDNFFWLSKMDCSGNELRLDQCLVDNKPFRGQLGKVAPSALCKPAGVFCAMTREQTKFEWRLKDNTTKANPVAGQVQVKLNGTWGAVCSSWYRRQNVANVFCRQEGYTAGDVISNSFGDGLDKVWINRIRCSGNESSLQECDMEIGTNSTCYSLLTVRCDQSVRLTTFSTRSSSQTLQSGLLQVATENGGLEAVCASTFNNRTADTTCKELGFKAAMYQSFKANIYSIVSGSANITCSATDSSISNCEVSTSSRKRCPGSLYVALFCLDTPSPREDLKITMQHAYAGYPRAVRYGFEGSICGDGFDENDADVVCRHQGYAKGYNLKAVRQYSTYVLPFVLSGLGCTGAENTLDKCPRGIFVNSSTDCSNGTTPNILCTLTSEKIQFRRQPPEATWGRAEVKIDGAWKAIDRSGFGSTEAGVFCKSLGNGFERGQATRWKSLNLPLMPVAVSKISCNGDENSILECSGNWTSAANMYKNSTSAIYVRCLRSVRLAYGTGRSGMVLYMKRGSWGAVCADKFDHNDARELFKRGHANTSQCHCVPYHCVPTKLRVDRSQDNWPIPIRCRLHSCVVCRELGYDNGYSVCCSPFGSTWRDYHYTDVECLGNETNIGQCQLSTDKGSLDSCHYRNYASVACYNNSDSTDYNLTFKGDSTYTGAVQINYLGTPGHICRDGWDDKDARVVCREMGFQNGMAYTHYRSLSSYYSSRSGPFWSSKFQCSGSESSLRQCPHVAFGNVTTCDGRHYAGALCYTGQAIVYRIVRSTDNNRTTAGRVEAFVNNRWSPLCRSYWGDSDAKVFCRSLGYNGGISTSMPTSIPTYTGPVLNGKMRCNGSEEELNDCVHEGWRVDNSSYCSDRLAAVSCFKNVRMDSLFGDTLPFGAFRLYTGDAWSLVCDDNFDDVTAGYVCRELGFNDGRALCCSAFTGVYIHGSLNETATLHCNGDESSLAECISEKPCSSGFYASVVCEVPNKPFSDTVFTITNSEEGPSGRLVVDHLGVKGRICDQGWSDMDAHVFCKSKGYTSGFAYYHSHEYEYNDETDIGPFFLSNFNCSGNETGLMDCPHTGRLDLGNCTHSASVGCYKKSGIQYRIAGGKANYGRVELAFDKKWGTVCDDDWDDVDAEVFCRSLNFTTGVAQNPGKYGRGTGPIWLKEVQCTGTESAIHACPHTGFTEEIEEGFWYYTPRCSTHKNDATVVCYKNVRVVNDYQLLDSGALQIYRSDEWKAVCDTGITNREAVVACKSLQYDFVDGVVIKGSAFGPITAPLEISSIKCNGKEDTLDSCTITTGNCTSGYYASVQCSNTTIDKTGYKVRLAEDTYSTDISGIVEIYDNGVWKRICHDGWDDRDAKVVCKELNFKGGVIYTHINRHFGPIGYRQFNCTSSETSLQHCSNSTTPDLENCHYDSYDAGVICYNGTGLTYSLSSGNRSMGRVDITYDGQTAGICSAHWSHNNSKVLCRWLGFNDGLPYEPDIPAPSYPFSFLNGVFCKGTETSLLECLNTGFNSSYLSYFSSNEAYTQCYQTTIFIKEIRLVLENGTIGTDRGRVEVFISGADEWGTVCDDFWDDFDATVVCRSLNFQRGKAQDKAAFGQGTGRIWLDNVECIGNETSLDQCAHRGYADHNCFHSEDAAVVCTNTPEPTFTPTPSIPTTLDNTTTPHSTTTTTPSTTTTGGPVVSAGRSTSGDKTVPIAVGVCVSVVVVLIVVIVLVVLIRRKKICQRGSVPHQRFSDDTMGVGPDGSISMHNQMYDAADPGSDPMRSARSQLAGDGEITLDNDRAVYSNNGHSNGHSGNLDSGFTNPLYSTMQPTTRQDVAGFKGEQLQAPDINNGGDDGGGKGSSA